MSGTNISEDTTMAAHKVFDIPELLEIILLQLRMTELFVNQRVNKAWRDWTQSSKPLSRKMFLTSGQLATSPKDIQCNPLLEKVIEKADSSSGSWQRPTATWRKMLLFRPALKNVTLYAYVEALSGRHKVERPSGRYKIDRVDGDGFCRSLTVNRFLCEVERKVMARRLMAKILTKFTIRMRQHSEGDEVSTKVVLEKRLRAYAYKER